MNTAMKRLAVLAVVVLALSGCASPAGQPATGNLNAASARTTDTRIAQDDKTFGGLQQRLRKLSEAGLQQNNYSLAKAQCWLDTARTQYSENDRSGYVDDALTEAARITGALESDRNSRAGHQTPLLSSSTRLREDLWTQLATLRGKDSALVCNGRTVACAEVRLVRAGHAEQQTGWRAATVHVQMAEDGIRRANAEAASCKP